MSEIRLTIKEAYLTDFLNYLKSLEYVKVEQVGASRPQEVAENAASLDPILDAAVPLPVFIPLETVVKEQQHVKTDWKALKQIAQNMAIQEPIALLFAQLKDISPRF